MKPRLLRRVGPALALLATGCNAVFYHPSRASHGDARKAGFAYADHYFESESGNRLHGRFFPAAEGVPRKGLWVFFHGNSRNLSGTYKPFAWVTRAGWDYFIFDYSGYGESGGEARREAIFRDGIAALRYVSATFPGKAGEKLVLAGESLGGAVLLGSAAAWEGRRTPSLYFVDCTFPSYEGMARAAMASRPWSRPFRFLGPWFVSDDYSPGPGLGSLSPVPLLISHCRDDAMVPFTMGERLYREAAEPKLFWPLEGCRHTQGFTDRFPANRKRLLERVDSLAALSGPG